MALSWMKVFRQDFEADFLYMESQPQNAELGR